MGEADKHGLPDAKGGYSLIGQGAHDAAKKQNGKPELRAPASRALAAWQRGVCVISGLGTGGLSA
jgi:hypothetical protein